MEPRIDPHAIELLCREFGTHEAGLPEWLKNAREAYLRTGAEAGERVIIVNLVRSSSRRRFEAIECIDFVGISGTDLEAKYLVWANPRAAAAGASNAAEIEGGQGNGGKAYGRQMFKEFCFASVCAGGLSVVRFQDPKTKHLLGFVAKDSSEDSKSIVPSGDRSYAEGWCRRVGKSPAGNVTIVRGDGPKGGVTIDKIDRLIQRSAQARETIRTCDVRLFVNGQQRKVFKVESPDLHPDFKEPICIPIPSMLDYGGTKVATTKPGFAAGELTIHVARDKLKTKWKGWSQIVFRGAGVRSLGVLPTSELDLSQPALREHIFGEVRLPLLEDPNDSYETQSRQRLKIALLSKALYRFVADQIDARLSTLQKVMAVKGEVKQKKKLERLHQRLENWIGAKLKGFDGLADAGEDEGKGRRKRKRDKGDTGDPRTLDHVRIHRDALEICSGATYQLRANGFDTSGQPMPAGRVTWRSSNPSIARVEPTKGVVEPVQAGLTTITCEDHTGRMASNKTLVQVHEPIHVEIRTKSPAHLSPNRRLTLDVRVKTAAGRTVKRPVVRWAVDQDDCVRVNPDGVATGGLPGLAEITASAGGVSSDPLEIEVERGSHGDAAKASSARPRILVSGLHPDPVTGQTVELFPSDPPVHQRIGSDDIELNVFWINLQSPLATALYDKGPESLQWRTYHFQRIVDVYVRLEVHQEFGDQKNLDANQILDECAERTAQIYTDAAAEDILEVLSEERLRIDEK